MQIDCYLSEHCGSYHQLRETIHAALAGLSLRAAVAFHTVTYDEAVAMDIKGSPEIRLDGRDLFDISGPPAVT